MCQPEQYRDRIQHDISIKKIYSSTTITIINLGTAAENSELIFPLLKAYHHDCYSLEGSGGKLQRPHQACELLIDIDIRGTALASGSYALPAPL